MRSATESWTREKRSSVIEVYQGVAVLVAFQALPPGVDN
jgi:hypothetical protein